MKIKQGSKEKSANKRKTSFSRRKLIGNQGCRDPGKSKKDYQLPYMLVLPWRSQVTRYQSYAQGKITVKYLQRCNNCMERYQKQERLCKAQGAEKRQSHGRLSLRKLISITIETTQLETLPNDRDSGTS